MHPDRFLADHENVRHDLEHPSSPRTWLGYVAEACSRRFASLATGRSRCSPATTFSQWRHRGKALLSFGEARDAALRKWMETNYFLPNSMVDRNHPRTTEENRATIAQKFGVLDLAPVVSEPFRQWVLEDAFIAGRPAWEQVGAQMTTDVAPTR